MKKKKKIMLLTIALVTAFSSFAYADSIGGSSKTIKISDSQIKFESAYDAQMKYNYNGYIFTKRYYESEYGIYSPLKTGDTAPWNTMRNYLKENMQTMYGVRGEHLVSSKDLNLKKGRTDPSKWGAKAYQGDNTGTFAFTNMNPVRNYEFRYIGYTKEGLVVDNPFFPADDSSGKRPDLKNWLQFGEVASVHKHTQSEFNKNEDKAKRTFEAWFNGTEVGGYFRDMARTKGAAVGSEWIYWNKRMQILSDIDDGAGILKGWHSVNGRLWYETFAIPKQANKNISLTKLELIDPDTGEVLTAHTRELDMSDVFNISKAKVSRTNPDALLVKGKKYIIKAEYLYSSRATDKNIAAPATKTGSIEVDRHIAYDENMAKYNVFDPEYLMAKGLGHKSIDKPEVMETGEFAHFEWEYTIPADVKSKGAITYKVPPEYAANGDNQIQGDDWLSLSFVLANNDIGFTRPVELINSAGSQTDTVLPNQNHTVKFNVKHFLGNSTIGLDSVDNPKTTIDVEIKDKSDKVILKQTIQSTELLEPEKQISISVPNVKTNTGAITACATINKVHKEKGLNSNPSNDKICETFASAKNYAIKELKINPHYINVPSGTSNTNQTLNFVFTASHEGADGIGDTPTVVVRQNGKEIKRASIILKGGMTRTESWPIPVSLGMGNNTFEVEINPAPRTVTEFRGEGLDPYADNIGRDTVVVRRNQACVECTVGPRTYNSWTEKFEIAEWSGHIEYYDDCVSFDKDGECRRWVRVPYCVTDSYKSWTETYNYNESYKITNVYFRSKWSKDTQGGDGWVDLLKTKGKIKAGYGFELKVVTNYNTNRNNMPSPPWSSGCSGRSVSPWGTPGVSSPTIVYLKMPYSDGAGKNVCYILNAENPVGSWNNKTQDYQLPLRDSFNIKSEKKIYINEKAKPGMQTLQITTPIFYGHQPMGPGDRSNKKNMQDCKTVQFEILANDDLKTHIVQ